ncbi:glutaminyl-peptide cyclotransferase [Amycolatopsis sp. cg5]|uniref:glutaminyl-peptide cyclotransferase n=1 Tax=Amycolatopsis sp. cg5 TaxID=3238802 RepID=UPI003525AD65
MRKLIFTPLLAIALCGCANTPASSVDTGPQRLRPEIVRVLPHDVTAFTEGLEFAGNTLFEGTGLEKKSIVQAGPAGEAPTVKAALAPEIFGEGITVLGPKLWQLTWRNGFAIERDTATLAELRRVPYQGEGWGLCHQKDRLVMSNGSDTLTFRDPVTFAVTGTVRVGQNQLNELECVGDDVYVNVWQTDRILRFNLPTAKVTGTIDASGLLTAGERTTSDVLNGIAAVPGSDRFVLTGKLWPKMFEVRFVPNP